MKVAKGRVGSRAWAKRLLVALALLLLTAAQADAEADLPDGARVEAASDGASPRLEARLLRDARPGEPPRAGVLFDIDPEWHLYWKNPGETGLAPELSWSVEGGTAGPLAWPAPEVFRSSDDFNVSYGYSDQVLLASELLLEPGHTGARRDRDRTLGQDDLAGGKKTPHAKARRSSSSTRADSRSGPRSSARGRRGDRLRS